MMESVENEQKKLKAELDSIKQGNPRDKSEELKKTINNIKIFITQEKSC